ncbi:MAG: hypothetical protein U1E76_09960 [Planctomycetota bacterium]
MTPAENIAGIVTEHGIIEHPNRERIAEHFARFVQHEKKPDLP